MLTEIIALIVLVLIVALAAYKIWQPHIEIIQIGAKRVRILLWYNSYDSSEIDRTYTNLGEYGKKD